MSQSNHTRRLERLEQGRTFGSCVACALARLTDKESHCDGDSCWLSLADLLMKVGIDDMKSIERQSEMPGRQRPRGSNAL
jgi:hypothetical protein